MKVNATYASEYAMPISAFGSASLISNVHITDYEIVGTCYTPQIGGFTSSGTPTILNSSISFKSGQVLKTDSYVRYTPPAILGGICAWASGSPTWENVTVDFGNIEFRKTDRGYSYDMVFGGLFGLGSISTDNIDNVTIRGNVTVNNYGSGNTYKASVYIYSSNGYNPNSSNAVVNTMEGVDVSGLTIY